MTPVPDSLINDVYTTVRRITGAYARIDPLLASVGLMGEPSHGPCIFQGLHTIHQEVFDGIRLRFTGERLVAYVAFTACALERRGRPVPPEIAALSARLFMGGHVELLPEELPKENL